MSNAIVCRNGHVICEAVKTFPHRVANFCKQCGEAGIRQCEHCGTELQGYKFIEMEHISPKQSREGMDWSPPNFCPNCGTPYPWTARGRQAITDAIHALEGLTPSQREMLTKSIPDIISDTPQSGTAALNLRKFTEIATKAKKPAAIVLQNVLTQFATATVKRVLGIN